MVFMELMNTQIIELTKDRTWENSLLKAGQIIQQGGLVAFPTETVYGLGGDALNPESAKRIYAAKGRPSDNPLIVHIHHLDNLTWIARDIPEAAWQLAKAFWPGPLTMVLPRGDRVPLETTGGLDTVAVRMPSDPVALAFIQQAGGFVAAPSANLSGRPSPTSFRYVLEDMEGKIEMILAGEDSKIGLESTIIDLTSIPYLVLRPGSITIDQLQRIVGRVEMDPSLLQEENYAPPKAPGMRYRHYAPRGELTIIEGERKAVGEWIKRETLLAAKTGKKTGIICTIEGLPFYRLAKDEGYIADSVKCLGEYGQAGEIASNLYRALRELDEEGIEVIYAEVLSYGGKEEAVMNRLLKAAGNRLIKI